MTATRTLYVDEAGNAGANYLDKGQPFHVAAGWLMEPAIEPAVAQAVVELRSQGGGEMKGSNLMRRPRGRRRVRAFIEVMGQLGALPFFVIMDRPFSIAGKLVEVFLDPMHHDAVPWLPSGAFEARRRLAERLATDLSSEALDEFAETYRAPGEHGFSPVLSTVIAELEALGAERRVVDGFRGALDALPRFIAEEVHDHADTNHAQWAALNVPAFGHLLRRVDSMMDVVDGTFDAVHDEVHQFDLPFRQFVESMRVPEGTDPNVMLPDGRRYRWALKNLGEYEMADSEARPAVQAADVLASAVLKSSLAALEAANGWADGMREVAEILLPALITPDGFDDPPFAGIYAPEATTGRMLASLLRR